MLTLYQRTHLLYLGYKLSTPNADDRFPKPGIRHNVPLFATFPTPFLDPNRSAQYATDVEELVDRMHTTVKDENMPQDYDDDELMTSDDSTLLEDIATVVSFQRADSSSLIGIFCFNEITNQRKNAILTILYELGADCVHERGIFSAYTPPFFQCLPH